MSDPLQDAAAQQQSPDAPIPLPVNPAGGIMGTGQPAPNQQQQTQPSQAQPTQPSAGEQIKERLATVGHAVTHFAHALEGKQVNYVTDPDTGDVTSQVVPRKPGGFFRDILLGAIAGGAAASQPTAHPSGAAGFALGFQGADAQQQQAQQMRKQQATDKGQEIQKTNADNLAQAAIAHNTVSNIRFAGFVDQHTPEEVSRISASADALKQQALKMGGQLADIPGVENGKAGNGPALMQKYNSDPSILQGPEGYHRVPLFSFAGTDGLQHDGKNWSDGEGTPDWNKNHGTVTLVDIPNALWNEKVTLTREQANAIAGYEIAKGGKGSKPTDPVNATYGSLFSLGLKNIKDANDAHHELYRVPKDASELNQWDQQRQDIQARMQSDPASVTDDEKRWLGAKGPMIDRAKQQAAAAPVTVSNMTDAQNMLNSDKPSEVNAARDFFVSSLAGANGDKIAAFIQANPNKFSADQVKTAKSWVKQYGGIKASEKDQGNNGLFSGTGSSGPDFIKTLPPGLQSQVKAFGEGRLNLSATPRGKEKTALIQTLTRAYPDFDQYKGETWGKTRNEYMGSGQTAKKVVSYNTALEHMSDLYDHSTFDGLYVPGSKDYSDRSVALNYVANEVGTAIKTGVMSQKEGDEILGSLKGWTPATSKERTAETARLLHDKIDEYQRKFQEAAPSQSIQAPILMSPKAGASYDHTQGVAQPQPQQAGPSVGDVKSYNGANYKFDGTQWKRQ